MSAAGDAAPYGAFGISYVVPDDQRAAAHGVGGSIAYAHPLAGRLWAEGRLFAHVLEPDAPAAESASQQGLGLDAVLALGDAGAGHLFVFAGGGLLHNEVSPEAEDPAGAYGNAGFGWRFAPWRGGALRARVEARAIADTFQEGRNDLLVAMAVELGPRPRPVAAAEPPAPRVVHLRPAPLPAPPASEPAPASADADADGVPDAADRCAHTLAGAKVARDGCVWEEQTVRLANIRFESGLAVLTPDSKLKLDEVASFFRNQADVKMDVYGHTDGAGAADYNQTLSELRADAVREYLVSQGIAAGRLDSRGFGESRPIADDATEQGRAVNRRVELHIHARQPQAPER